MRWAKETRAQLRGMQRDVSSLSDHAAYLTNKITFLLDAMLGVVSIEQNNVIKLFSVAAVVFMPPTLLVGIYGMNVPLPKFPGGDEVQFWWLTGLCVAMIVAMLFVFRRRRRI